MYPPQAPNNDLSNLTETRQSVMEPVKQPVMEPIKQPVMEPVKQPVMKPVKEVLKDPSKDRISTNEDFGLQKKPVTPKPLSLLDAIKEGSNKLKAPDLTSKTENFGLRKPLTFADELKQGIQLGQAGLKKKEQQKPLNPTPEKTDLASKFQKELKDKVDSKIACSECGKLITKQNMARHMKTQHGFLYEQGKKEPIFVFN